MEYINYYDSPLGGITLASDGENLIGLWFDGQKYFGDTLDIEHEEKNLPIFKETKKWLDKYFAGKDPGAAPPINMKTTEFRKAVWQVLLKIPYGKTMTYGEIAKAIEKDNKKSQNNIKKQDGIKLKNDKQGSVAISARAVGNAVGHNAISIIIPCHRVIGSDGSLTGYAGGIDKKIKLLELEGIDMTDLYMPK